MGISPREYDLLQAAILVMLLPHLLTRVARVLFWTAAGAPSPGLACVCSTAYCQQGRTVALILGILTGCSTKTVLAQARLLLRHTGPLWKNTWYLDCLRMPESASRQKTNNALLSWNRGLCYWWPPQVAPCILTTASFKKTFLPSFFL